MSVKCTFHGSHQGRNDLLSPLNFQSVNVVLAEGTPKSFSMIESKLTDTNPSPVLKNFQNALNIPAVQLVNEGDGYKRITNNSQPILVAPAFQWLAQLP